MDRIDDYDFELPEEQIATEPLEQRDHSRLLVVDRRSESISHHRFVELPRLLQAGDRLVLNDTQVLPARLVGQRTNTGGKWEGLFLGTTPEGAWKLIGQCRGKLQPGEQITLVPAHRPESSDRLLLNLVERQADDVWIVQPNEDVDLLATLKEFGTVPLPPYIRRKLANTNDWQRYQTTYSREPGAVAAPTAGLHFTSQLLQACSENSIDQSHVTLHVGLGTFRPIAVSRLSEHQMHSEWCRLPEETASLLNETRSNGGRIVAVGTTAVRTLETAAQSGLLCGYQGETDIFIRPPYEFRAVDVLLTNFHLPRSTLLVLVCAFAGNELIKEAYQSAIREGYRFYSYGDAMLIL